MSRTVSANITVSLDGFVAGPGDDMSWLIDGYWPAVADNPAADARSRELSRYLDAVEKVVVSRTLTEATWSNARVARDLEAEVRALLAADLLDELRVTRVPAILGQGRPFLAGALPRSSWSLESLQTIPTGAIVSLLRRR